MWVSWKNSGKQKINGKPCSVTVVQSLYLALHGYFELEVCPGACRQSKTAVVLLIMT